MASPVILLTDFGSDLYVGQVKAALLAHAPDAPLIDLVHDLAPHDSRLAAYLLAALMPWMPPDAVMLCVVDPGVGGSRLPLMARLDGRWLVGPDNGLLALAVRRSRRADVWGIDWRPDCLSASFHGRDLFAPVAARLCQGQDVPGQPLQSMVGDDWPDECARIVYQDRFGNLISGTRAASLPAGARIKVGDTVLSQATTFCDRPVGQGFWYENSNGLVELAVNQGNAAKILGMNVGDIFTVLI